MKLKTVYARFFKSFNFDHLRKAHPEAKPKPWEEFRGLWFPYVEVRIDHEITTIVGANESGKSHLLSAIKKAITGKDLQQRDLCRYSPFFNVERGKGCWPHLGVEWVDVSPEEAEVLKSELKGGPATFDSFLMFREAPDALNVYIPNGEGGLYSEQIEGEKALTFGRAVLPRPFEIKPDIALPSAVPLPWLLDPSNAHGALASRSIRSGIVESISVFARQWAPDVAQFSKNAPTIFDSLDPYFGANGKLAAANQEKLTESLGLARDLLLRLADVEPERLSDLSRAIADHQDGHANALVSRINEQLAKRLNFPKWWVQDRDFSLKVTLREMELVFTIQDRTGTEYTFEERSSGLKYFLSYLIQSQCRERSKGQFEILLMDEPDTYLSAEAQQDLLKIFDDFAKPQADVNPIQVVFVTHSPFLIDKNHADRIRVLEKGKGLDGTRVIRNISQNHYEPLRSAFGAFVGETAFIGSCNLLVEGVADQILISGAARLIRNIVGAAESETLDLNRIVIVPCGSASQVPYMLYLIRGRDADKPPVIALLDSDPSGDAATKLMRKDHKQMRRLIDKAYVIQLGDLSLFESPPATIEIEDLIPAPLAVAAANSFLAEVGRFHDVEAPRLTLEEFVQTSKGKGVFDALNAAANIHGLHIEKMGFARAVIDQCKTVGAREPLREEVDTFLTRMRRLFKAVNEQRRNAERESTRERVGSRIARQQKIFSQDYPSQATKEQALIGLEAIEHVLDETLESDAVRTKINIMKKKFGLDDGLSEPVTNYGAFLEELRALKDEFAVSRLDSH